VHERDQVTPVGIQRIACQTLFEPQRIGKGVDLRSVGNARKGRSAWGVGGIQSKLRYSAFFTQQTGDKTMRWIQKISLCLGLGAIAMASVAHAQQQQFVNVLTGGQSGVYYPLGVALSQVYAKSIPNARATAQVTKASAENLNLLQAGRGELAFTLGDALSDAWKGDAEAGFQEAGQVAGPFRHLQQLHPDRGQCRRRHQDAGRSQGQAHFGGRGQVGHRTQRARHFQGRRRMSYADLAKVEYLPFGESVELIKNRQLDATLQSAGLGVASIRDLATAVKIVVVPVPADVVAKVGDAAYQGAVIPANTYGPDAGRTHGRHSQLSGDAQWCLRRAGLPDGKADVREPGHVAHRTQRRQGDCA
jgi:TRAP transporter TAXI family solute receptor